MADNLDLEEWKRQLKEEITTDVKNIIQKAIGEMLQTNKSKQSIDLDEGKTTNGRPRGGDDELEAVLPEPPKQGF